MTIILLKLQISALMLSLAFSGGGVSKEQAISQAQQTIQEALTYVSSITPTSTPVIAQPIQSEPIATGIPVIQDVATSTPQIEKSCEIKYSDDGNITTIEWTLNNISATKIRGKVLKRNSLDGDWFDTGYGLLNQSSGSYPNQNKTKVEDIFPYGMKADFDGTTCETKLEKDIRP